MRRWTHIRGMIALIFCLCLGAGAGLAGHLQTLDAPLSGGEEAKKNGRGISTALPRRGGQQQNGLASRGRGAPSPRAIFLRDPACAAGCLPPGQLLDFGTVGSSGRPGNLPKRWRPSSRFQMKRVNLGSRITRIKNIFWEYTKTAIFAGAAGMFFQIARTLRTGKAPGSLKNHK